MACRNSKIRKVVKVENYRLVDMGLLACSKQDISYKVRT